MLNGSWEQKYTKKIMSLNKKQQRTILDTYLYKKYIINSCFSVMD